MINREELVSTLADFAGPLGPFETPEQSRRRQIVWWDQLDHNAVALILDIVSNPPVAQRLSRMLPNPATFVQYAGSESTVVLP